MASYPLFIPPGHLGASAPRDWTKAQAREYLSWIQENAGSRTRELLRFFNVPAGIDPRAQLDEIGVRVSDAIRSEPFSDGRQLSDAGLALAADLGLLVAEMLRSAHPTKVRWSIDSRSPSSADFNQPVLVGFGKEVLNPIGGSIAEAAAVLQTRRSGDVWLRMFDYWTVLVGKQTSSAR